MRLTPVLSIIVPFHNVESYVFDLCEQFSRLESSSIEVLFVDDCSNDGSTFEIERCFKKLSVEFRVLKSKRRGPGFARNVGLIAARGKYIGFLDADDIVVPNALLQLCERMSACDADMAVFNHCRLYPNGEKRNNRRSDLLKRSGPVITESDKLKLLDNFNVAWNKIYRRSLIDRFQFRFPDGIYEDIPWSIACLFAADKVIVEPEVLYTYRQHPVSALKVVGEPHLVLPAQYERAIDFCVQHGCSESWKNALVARAVEHGLLIAYKRKRMGWRHRMMVFSELMAAVDKFDARGALQETERLTGWEKLAFTMRFGGILELRHFTARVVRFNRRVWRVGA